MHQENTKNILSALRGYANTKITKFGRQILRRRSLLRGI